MGLTKYKLGELIEQCDIRNADEKYTVDDVRGISTGKEFIETKANMDGVSLASYKVVKCNEFAYVADTSRRGEKIAIAINENRDILISSIYTVFRVRRTDLLFSDYLFMYFNRPEFDRYSRFNSWGSARETFGWEDMCDIEIELPELQIQQKYVDIYNAMLENQKNYERGLGDIKMACEASVEKIRKTHKSVSIIDYLVNRTETNLYNTYKDLIGVGSEGLITPRGSRDESTFYKCNIFYPRDFVYNPSVISKGAIAFNNVYDVPKICTEEYIVFYVRDESILSPEYLFLWLKRSETGRFLEFVNMDSVRNRVYFRDLEKICIPIPNVSIQQDLANMYVAYYMRKTINEKLKTQIKDICPILIKGSVDEARKTKEA